MKKRPIILLALMLCIQSQNTQANIIDDVNNIKNQIAQYAGYIDHYARVLPDLNEIVNIFNRTISETNAVLQNPIQPSLTSIKNNALQINNESVKFEDANQITENTNPVDTIKEVQASVVQISNMITYIQNILDEFLRIALYMNYLIHNHNQEGHPQPRWGWSTTISYAGEFMKRIDRPNSIKSVSELGAKVSQLGLSLSSNGAQYENLVKKMIPQAKNTLESLKSLLNNLVAKMNGPLQQLHGLAGGQ